MTNTINYSDVLQAADFEAEAIRTNYSGRGMYGAECFGFVGNISDYSQFVAVLASLMELDEFRDLLDDVRDDNMGLSTIFYFPGWTLTNVPEDDDDE